MTHDTRYDFLVVDFDRTLCRLFSNTELQRMANTLETEIPLLKELVSSYQMKDPYEMWGLVRRLLVTETAPILVTLEATIRQRLFEWEDDRATNVEPFDGVESSLSELARQRRSVAIYSNNDESVIQECLNRWGVAGTVAAVVGRSPEAPVSELKPSGIRLEQLLSSFGAASSATLYVGDSDEDAECAARLSVDFVRVSSDNEIGKVDGVLGCFEDVLEYLDRLGR